MSNSPQQRARGIWQVAAFCRFVEIIHWLINFLKKKKKRTTASILNVQWMSSLRQPLEFREPCLPEFPCHGSNGPLGLQNDNTRGPLAVFLNAAHPVRTGPPPFRLFFWSLCCLRIFPGDATNRRYKSGNTGTRRQYTWILVCSDTPSCFTVGKSFNLSGSQWLREDITSGLYKCA